MREGDELGAQVEEARHWCECCREEIADGELCTDCERELAQMVRWAKMHEAE